MDDKIPAVLETFNRWSKHNCGDDVFSRGRLEFNPDGSGRLLKSIISVALEFADIDELLAYMQKRLPTTDEEFSEAMKRI